MRISELDGLRVGVWGGGREGVAALTALQDRDPGRELILHNDEPLDESAQTGLLAIGSGVSLVTGPEGVEALAGCDAVIRSPGVSRYRPELDRLRDAGVRLTTGTNLWFAEHGNALVIAVTGTKGKSTTSALIAHLARATGLETVLAGNIGEPLLAHIDPAKDPDLWVVELSSFQTSDLIDLGLEGSPRVAVVLNLFAEHLDWHGEPENYWRDKLRLAESAVEVVANVKDDRLVERLAFIAAGRTTWFGDSTGWHVTGRRSIAKNGSKPRELGPKTKVIGRHNLVNLCAALTALERIGVEPQAPEFELREFRPLPHRLEDLGRGAGLRYINDSIATVPEAGVAALDALVDDDMTEPVALIAGGYERGQDFAALAERVLDGDQVRVVVGLPDNGRRLLAEIGERRLGGGAPGAGSPKLVEAGDMTEAVTAAAIALGDRGTVLLSPGAPSFGAYADFEERGRAFAAAASARGWLA